MLYIIVSIVGIIIGIIIGCMIGVSHISKKIIERLEKLEAENPEEEIAIARTSKVFYDIFNKEKK